MKVLVSDFIVSKKVIHPCNVEISVKGGGNHELRNNSASTFFIQT